MPQTLVCGSPSDDKNASLPLMTRSLILGPIGECENFSLFIIEGFPVGCQNHLILPFATNVYTVLDDVA